MVVEWERDRDCLVDCLRQTDGCLVAFSGGVDSAVVARAAYEALGTRAIAVTATSPSVAAGELETACHIARTIGIRHEIVATREIEDPRYVANPFDRCYFCKSELYARLGDWLAAHPDASQVVRVIVNGANVDDLGDHRPGLRAAGEHSVRSPLAECGLTKERVRAIARGWAMEVADKPATPCLASRIAYGEVVTVERMQRIDQAEQWLRQRGFPDVRVRLHPGELARLEVAVEDLARLAGTPLREELTTCLEKLGFRFVTVDLRGRRSGSLNGLVPLEQLEHSARG